MSTVNVFTSVQEVTGRQRQELFRASAATEAVDELTSKRIRLLKGESITVTSTKLFVCSVNIPILIQITKALGNSIEFTLSSSISIPTDATIQLTNPADNTLELPALISLIAI